MKRTDRQSDFTYIVFNTFGVEMVPRWHFMGRELFSLSVDMHKLHVMPTIRKTLGVKRNLYALCELNFFNP